MLFLFYLAIVTFNLKSVYRLEMSCIPQKDWKLYKTVGVRLAYVKEPDYVTEFLRKS